jgi:hypothetical protein
MDVQMPEDAMDTTATKAIQWVKIFYSRDQTLPRRQMPCQRRTSDELPVKAGMDALL